MNPVARRFLNFVILVFTVSSISYSQIVISEFRFRGPNGGSDEFVELYNPTNAAVDISGWKLKGSNSAGTTSTRSTVPAGRILQPGQYYLFTNSSSSGGPYSGAIPGDQTYATGITDDGGIAITLPSDVIVDQVGLSAGSAFKEGTPLASLGSSNQNRGYERKPGGASCNGGDTNVNADDFQLINPSNPQNRASAFCLASGLGAEGSASPSTVTAGGSTLLTVSVNPASDPASTGITVSGDLSSIGGSPFQTFFDDGTSGDATAFDNIFSFLAVVPSGVTVGSKSLPVSAADAEGRTATAAISLTVEHPVVILQVHDIQGNSSRSPYETQEVMTRGIVTGRKSSGFFIQTPDVESDADPNSSEGVFVFTSNTPPSSASVGNLVTVKGTVSEFVPSSDPFSPPLTEISGSPVVTLVSSGNALPSPIGLTASDTSPMGSIEQLEKFEGMRVSVNSLTVVGPTQGNVSESNATAASNGVFYGVITGVARPFREPGIETPLPVPPGAPSAPIFDANPERLRIDSDGQPGAGIIDVTSGALVTNIVGPLDYGFRTYTILPDPSSPPGVSGNISAVAVSDPQTDELTVATFNMQRFYDTVNDPATSDVVLTTTAFNNRLNKASLVIRTLLKMPDIVGVVEMENLTTLQTIASRLNADAVAAGIPDPMYQPYLAEGNDVGGIDVGFLVKSSRVTVIDVVQEGKTATYTNPSNGLLELLNDRPPLVLRAELQRPSTPPFPITVIAVHQRSLNGVDDPVDGPRVREKRKAQAEFLANLIQARQSANPGEYIMSLGDYNAFQFNDGYVDAIGTVVGTPSPAGSVASPSPDLVNPDLFDLVNLAQADRRYSYVFDGNAQELDHVIVNQPLLARIGKVEYARVNADFPEVYRTDPSRPERLSDHDPAVAFVTLPPQNHPPQANAGEDRVVECSGHSATSVTLDGSGSSDTDGDSLVYTWKKNGSIVAGPSGSPSAVLSLGLGNHTFELIVDDLSGGTDSDTVTVHVVDTTPPAISITLNPQSLWPPNHKLVDVAAAVAVTDSCDPNPTFVLMAITSNEPDQTNGGDKPNDIQEARTGTPDLQFKLRAERLGANTGRTYTVVYRAIDASGNTRTDSARVTVPHDMSAFASLSSGPSLEIPAEFSVDQNYPNPFNPSTLFRYGLPIAARVSLKVYNIIGQEIAVLVDREVSAGFHTVEWNAGQMPSGIYIFRLTAGDFVETGKLILMK